MRVAEDRELIARFLQVPCEVEIRMGEETRIQKFMPLIRAIEGNPDRWAIDGGI